MIRHTNSIIREAKQATSGQGPDRPEILISEMPRLIGAILLKAIEDWENPQKRTEVQEFLTSEWFGELAEGLQLQPELIREQLMTGDYQHVGIRGPYR